MPKYTVIVPIAGSLEFDGVEADSPEDAIQKAMCDLDHEAENAFLTWETMEHVVEGNVCYAPCTHAEVIEEE